MSRPDRRGLTGSGSPSPTKCTCSRDGLEDVLRAPRPQLIPRAAPWLGAHKKLDGHNALAQAGHVGEAPRAERQHGRAILDPTPRPRCWRARTRPVPRSSRASAVIASPGDRVERRGCSRPLRGTETARQARPGRSPAASGRVVVALRAAPGQPGEVEPGREGLAPRSRNEITRTSATTAGCPAKAFSSTASRRSNVGHGVAGSRRASAETECESVNSSPQVAGGPRPATGSCRRANRRKPFDHDLEPFVRPRGDDRRDGQVCGEGPEAERAGDVGRAEQPPGVCSGKAAEAVEKALLLSSARPSPAARSASVNRPAARSASGARSDSPSDPSSRTTGTPRGPAPHETFGQKRPYAGVAGGKAVGQAQHGARTTSPPAGTPCATRWFSSRRRLKLATSPGGNGCA